MLLLLIITPAAVKVVGSTTSSVGISVKVGHVLCCLSIGNRRPNGAFALESGAQSASKSNSSEYEVGLRLSGLALL